MADNMNLEIGERVRKKREEVGFTREQLSELIGVSALFLGFIECGQRGMSINTLQKLCRALNVSADYIILGKPCNENDIKSTICSVIYDMDEKYYSLAIDTLNHFKKTVALIENANKIQNQ